MKTLVAVDKRWLARYLWKYAKQNTAFITNRIFQRTYWNVTEGGVTVKLGFFTPYHQSIAKSQHERAYEIPVMRAWLDEIDGKKVIYDLGGFNGLYGLIAAKKNPSARVVIFEPDHVNAEHIRENIRLNNLSNCTAEEAAVSDYSGTTLFTQGGTSGEHMGGLGAEVRVVALKDLPPADLIKIDVEGAELKVLKGMGYKSTILLEVHPLFLYRSGDTEGDVDEYLKNEGYDVTFIHERDRAKHYLVR
jgi:FkbM family methyltransferase